jgi:hypothetical protein
MNLKVWLGVAVSAALLWYAMRDVDFGRAWEAAQRMNAIFLVPYILVAFGEVPLRALRWQVLLLPVQRTSLLRLSSATLIGLMANNVLPARAGEFLRAYVAARAEHLAFSTSFATCVIDRVFDGLTVSAIFVFAVLAGRFEPPNEALRPLAEVARASGYFAAIIYLGTLAFLVGLIVRQSATPRLVGLVLRLFPKRFAAAALGWLGSFVGGLGVFRQLPLLGISTVISVAVWLGYGLGLYLMWLAFDVHLGVIDAFIALLILTIGLTLPSTPGFVGVMEAAVVTGLEFYGVDRSSAFAIAVVYHITQYVPITLGGFLALWFERLSFTDIARVEEDQAPPSREETR